LSKRKHAIVIGGSLAGLCAGQVLSDYFEQVTLIDRDCFEEGPAHRKGCPQSKHPHFLLDSGRDLLEEFFPGFEKNLKGYGGHEFNGGLDTANCEPAGWCPRKTTPLSLLYASRPLLDWTVRELASKTANVTVLEGTSVTGLLVSKEDQSPLQIKGVIVREGSQEPREIPADLVVDAGGRGTKVPKWLAEAGAPELEVSTLDAGVIYSSRWYQAPAPEDRPEGFWWKSMVVQPSLSQRDLDPNRIELEYVATLHPIEDNKWTLVLGSWGKKEMPGTPEAFEHAVGNLRTPAFANALACAEPISDVFVHRATQNIWRRYERWADPPEGFVALGDAACAFNPIYGQGITTAATSCAWLKELLKEGYDATTSGFARNFFAKQASFYERPWAMSLSRDVAQPGSTGSEAIPDGFYKKLKNRLALPIFQVIQTASREDDVVRDGFVDVYNLKLNINSYIASPRILFGIARAYLKRAVGLSKLPASKSPLESPPADIFS
jgi:2-polyprenyl-6-methoxyphenol hydroxylase-like FAD-dependent oxidoreductase